MIAFGWLMLMLWPVVGLILYKRLPLHTAVILTLLGGYLLLPATLVLDLPVLPAFSKVTIPVLTALMLTVIGTRDTQRNELVLRGWLPRDPVALLLLLLLFGSVFGTNLTNRDVLVYGPRVLPALRLYDAFSVMLELLVVLIPFFVGRKLLAGPEAQRTLLLMMACAGLIYTVPMLYEIRMSPQLHAQLYGVFPGAFYQQLRGDGFRPMVFVGHGLQLAVFMAFLVLATAGMMRISKVEDRLKWMVALLWVFAVLVLTKSLGPVLICLILLPILLVFGQRLQLMCLAGIAAALMLYPALRAAHVIPVDQIMTFITGISPDRAASFMTRLENEELLLAKALERPLFGWGIWGRQRVFDEFGRNLGITDGTWIIELGVGGWTRYIGLMGLLCWPVIKLYFVKREKVDPVCVVLAVIVTAKLVDLIPNSGIPAIIWLMAGALVGRLEAQSGAGIQTVSKTEQAIPGYRRDSTTAMAAPRQVEQQKYARSFPDKETRRAKPLRPYTRPTSGPQK